MAAKAKPGQRAHLVRPKALDGITDVIESTIQYGLGDADTPVFCFRYIHKDFGARNKNLTIKDRSQMLERLEALGSMTWGEIKSQPRHAYGTEQISVSQLKCGLPVMMPGDAAERDSYDRIVVFRRNGNKSVFAGVRLGRTFHIVYIEAKFGDLYDHGK
jgi:hypothetical protein